MENWDSKGRDADAPSDAMADIRRYLRLFWKHKWLFLLVFSGASAGLAYRSMTVPKVYAATTTIQISPQTPRVYVNVREVVPMGTGSWWASRGFFKTQYQVITSRAVASKVVRREGLDRDPDFLGIVQVRNPKQLADASRRADAVARLRGRVSAVRIEGSHLVRIRVEDGNPGRAVRLSRAVAHAYKDLNIELKTRETLRALNTLRSQKEQLRKKLLLAEHQLVEFKRRHGIFTFSTSARQGVVAQDLVAFTSARAKAESDRLRLAAQVAEAKKPDRARIQVERQELEQKSRSIGTLLALRENLRAAEADLLSRYKEKHPKVLASRRKMRLIDKRIRLERRLLERQIRFRIRAERNILERKLAAAKTAHEGFRKLVRRAERDARKLGEREKDFLRLTRGVDEARRVYELVSKRAQEVSLAKEIHNNNVSVLDEARGAVLVRPRLFYSLIFALGLGLFAGLAVVVLLNFFDNTLKTQEEIEQLLGLAFLGVLPAVRDEKGDKVEAPELVVHSHPKSTMAELCRSIRTNIQFMSPDRSMQTLLVTSPGPLEGKTTVAISLAISMAQAGQPVVLVSTDMRRPRVESQFGLSQAKGVSNWIVDDATLDEVLHKTEVPNLTVLPCGPIPPNPAEILHAEKFRKLVEELEARFDRIIFDSPPVGLVTDPQILSVMVDGVILVIRAGVTSREGARQATRKLEAINAHLLGAVLNHLDLRRGRYGHYYERYGYYHRSDADESKQRAA